MDDRFMLFGMESFNELLNQVLPASVNIESVLMKIIGSGFDESKLSGLLSQIAKIFTDPLENLDDDLKYHMKQQLGYAINKKIVIKSDILGDLTVEILQKEPKIKIYKSTSEDITKFPVITLNKDAILSILGRKATMLEMILKKQISISNTIELAQGFTRLLLAIPTLYLTQKELLVKVQQGFQSLFSQFN